MKNALKELAVAFAALSLFSVYLIFFYVYVAALATFFFVGTIVILARSTGMDIGSEGHQVVILLTSLMVYGEATNRVHSWFDWGEEARRITESVEKSFGLNF